MAASLVELQTDLTSMHRDDIRVREVRYTLTHDHVHWVMSFFSLDHDINSVVRTIDCSSYHAQYTLDLRCSSTLTFRNVHPNVKNLSFGI